MNNKLDTTQQGFLEIVKEAAPYLVDFYKQLTYKFVEECQEYVIVDESVIIVEEEFFHLPKKSQKIFLQAEVDMTNMNKECTKKACNS